MDIIKEKWEEILYTVKLEHELTDVSCDTWLKPLKVHSFEKNGSANTLYILIPAEQQPAFGYILAEQCDTGSRAEPGAHAGGRYRADFRPGAGGVPVGRQVWAPVYVRGICHRLGSRSYAGRLLLCFRTLEEKGACTGKERSCCLTFLPVFAIFTI